MADAFSRKWMIRYTEETDQYYPALLDVLKKVPEWNNAWWLLRYQMMTMMEAFKRLL
jgi:GTP pyrophosphokinase